MPMTAAQFITLKARADKEWARRKYTGSLAGYANKAWTPQTPAAGTFVYAGQGNLVITPLLKVKAYGNLSTAAAGNFIPSDFDSTKMTNWIAALEKEPVTGSSSCTSSCTGLCTTACSGACKGTCSGGCSGCGSGCASGCSGCSGGCQGCGSGCAGGCSGCGNCGSGCTGCVNGCTGHCGTGCSGGTSCEKACSSTCASQCRGCGSCSGCGGSSCRGHARTA